LQRYSLFSLGMPFSEQRPKNSLVLKRSIMEAMCRWNQTQVLRTSHEQGLFYFSERKRETVFIFISKLSVQFYYPGPPGPQRCLFMPARRAGADLQRRCCRQCFGPTSLFSQQHEAARPTNSTNPSDTISQSGPVQRVRDLRVMYFYRFQF